jgi:hypothetical protein
VKIANIAAAAKATAATIIKTAKAEKTMAATIAKAAKSEGRGESGGKAVQDAKECTQ